MKKLVGGDYLLDLTPIDIEESVDVETYTNITNTDVIAQLTNLKKYVSNPSMIKPVWVKLKNGETDELVVARGEFKVVDDGEFEIGVQLDGYKLKIHIEFTQALNENNNPIDDWYIDTNDAKYLFTSDAQNIGAISELPVFENIVDKDGHKVYEYFDGEITPNTDWSNSELTFDVVFIKAIRNYGELQFIANFRVTNETENNITINPDRNICRFSIPNYLKEKIIAHNGNPTSQVNQGSIAYCGLFISYTSGAFDTFRYVNFFNSQEQLCFYNEGGSITIPAGQSRDFEARISLAI